MSKERNVVRLIRRHSKQLDRAKGLAQINVAFANLQLAHQAAEKSGFGELAQAVADQEFLSDTELIKLASQHLANPNKFIAGCLERVAAFDDLLTV